MACCENHDLKKLTHQGYELFSKWPDSNAAFYNFTSGEFNRDLHLLGFSQIFVTVNQRFIHIQDEGFFVFGEFWREVNFFFNKIVFLEFLQSIDVRDRLEAVMVVADEPPTLC